MCYLKRVSIDIIRTNNLLEVIMFAKRFFSLTFLALVGLAASNVAFAKHPPAQQVVDGVTQNVLAVFRKDKEKLINDKGYLKQKVDELVTPNMDFKSMSILILSKKRWKAASDQQKNDFIESFKELLTNTYAQSLNRFSDETIELLPFSPHPKRPEKLAVVKSLVKLGSGSDIPLNYKLRYQEDDGWKVYDIYVEGISIVTTYRGSFASTLATQGMDGLIAQIKKQNAKYK